MNKLHFPKSLVFCLLASFSISLGSCNQNMGPANDQSRSAPTASRGKPIDSTTVGSVSGTIIFAGMPPLRPPIDMDMDPACALTAKGPQLAEALIVNNGKLENVFVYVKDGLEGYAIPRPTQPAVLDQAGCRYSPHVLGLVAGQTLKILNSDNAMHNVHPVAKNNPQWNESQMPRDAPKERTFPNPELLLPIVCNQHNWMKMYVNVVSNPFFAVSDSQGHFSIPGLPPGRYTIAAVHERLGIQEMKVTISPKQDQAASFTFKQ